jgi:hypothetical protein
MGRRLREERQLAELGFEKIEVFRKDVEERTKTLYNSFKRQSELADEVFRLKKKIILLGGDPKQLELDI